MFWRILPLLNYWTFHFIFAANFLLLLRLHKQASPALIGDFSRLLLRLPISFLPYRASSHMFNLFDPHLGARLYSTVNISNFGFFSTTM
jgi:hypothetical protein